MSLEDFTFADNPDPRCPVVLVLDCSGSMGEIVDGETQTPIAALDSGLDTLVAELRRDPLARRRVEIAVVTFGTEATVASPFATVDNLVLPHLEASGRTSMGSALGQALDLIDERKRVYRANGVTYYRPWLMLLTDGLATDDTSAASQRIKAAEQAKSVAFFPIGLDGADFDALAKLGSRQPLRLRGMAFDELFVWLSASQSRVSASNPGDAVALPAPTGWAQV
jgi:uncharacterized protein YegL